MIARVSTLSLAFGLAVAGTAAAQATKAAAPDLSDSEVAHVAVTANTIDADLGRLAEARASNADVRQFAKAMIDIHTAVNAKAGELAKRLSVTPANNAVSQSLQTGAADARANLEKLKGRAFDRAYIEREVAYHAAVLEAMDNLLIPTTDNAELKALLEQVRPAIVAHLEHARHLKSSLEAES